MEDQLSQVRAIAERVTRSIGLDVFDAQLVAEALVLAFAQLVLALRMDVRVVKEYGWLDA